MQQLLGMTIEELKQFAVEMGEKPFRGKQIFIWLNRGVRSFDEMTDLPKAFRGKLEDCAQIGGCLFIGDRAETGAESPYLLLKNVKRGIGGNIIDTDAVEGGNIESLTADRAGGAENGNRGRQTDGIFKIQDFSSLQEKI